MPPDVSVIIPAYQAIPLILNAVQSAISQAEVTTEVVIAADDQLDYGSFLSGSGIPSARYVLCRTNRIGSGPAAARNLAVELASSEIIAPLDADDAFAPDRLRWLLSEVDRHGVATGPTVERDVSDQHLRVARPAGGRDALSAEELCTVRMPYFPLFHRQFFGDGWPDIDFAEDLVFNLSLLQQAGVYAFVEAAHYSYLQHEGSLSNAPDTVHRARRGYEQILQTLDAGILEWDAHIADVLRRVISEDIAAVEAHLARAARAESGEWRDVVRAPHEHLDGGGA